MRRNISFKVRKAILTRDNFKCNICGATNRQSMLEVDHIIPFVKGGTNDFDNLVTLCVSCNRGKNDDILRIKKLKTKLDEFLEKKEVEEKKEALITLRGKKIETRIEPIKPTITEVSDKVLLESGFKQEELSQARRVFLRFFGTNKKSPPEITQVSDGGLLDEQAFEQACKEVPGLSEAEKALTKLILLSKAAL